jgi:hypothetical protein
MFAKRPARCRLTLFVTAVAIGIGTARAHQMLYDQDGYRLAVGIDAGLGAFAVGNVDTGPVTSTLIRRCKHRSRPPSEAPRGIGSKDLPSRSSSWKRRFSISATPTLSLASSARNAVDGDAERPELVRQIAVSDRPRRVLPSNRRLDSGQRSG